MECDVVEARNGSMECGCVRAYIHIHSADKLINALNEDLHGIACSIASSYAFYYISQYNCISLLRTHVIVAYTVRQ